MLLRDLIANSKHPVLVFCETQEDCGDAFEKMKKKKGMSQFHFQILKLDDTSNEGVRNALSLMSQCQTGPMEMSERVKKRLLSVVFLTLAGSVGYNFFKRATVVMLADVMKLTKQTLDQVIGRAERVRFDQPKEFHVITAGPPNIPPYKELKASLYNLDDEESWMAARKRL